jgi:hypothetical protein
MNTFCEMNKTNFNTRLKFTNPKKWNNITKKIRSIETRKKDTLVRTVDFLKKIAKEDLEYYSNLIKTDIDQMKAEENSSLEIFNIRDDDIFIDDDEDDENNSDGIFMN